MRSSTYLLAASRTFCRLLNRRARDCTRKERQIRDFFITTSLLRRSRLECPLIGAGTISRNRGVAVIDSPPAHQGACRAAGWGPTEARTRADMNSNSIQWIGRVAEWFKHRS